MTSVPARAPAGPSRRRGAALTRAIFDTALAELARSGFDRLSFDKIAASAGTGKGVLYRRWATPAELVLEALTNPVTGFGDTPRPDTGSVRQDMIELLGQLAAALDLPQGRGLLTLITHRANHPELYARVRELIVEPRKRMLLEILRDAADRGEARPDAVTARVAATGPRLVIADALEHGTVTADHVRAIVDEILIPLVRPRN